ncbi:Protein of unknown function [Geodermatophilus africanus]|uniref:Zinc-ribbon domain-containing protein n=1 Tax=Geodermatophilus africanus TaxID=1137993 RepID=A0A1H3LF27_9ACTN|nr:zinc-ribbon domain-containing protein [Geodermatophilus africanus]SDY62568.1 Protein of unknown function [Geodermatophilus africanus]
MSADERRRGRSLPLTGRRGWKHGTVADHPHLAAQFDVAANGGRTPDQVNAGTPEKLSWACPAAPDHRWQASGANRVRGTGCPACTGQQVSVTNNLARHREVAAQFDIEANDGVTPDQVLAGTHRRYWWVCPAADDHRWQAPVAERVAGAGCPACIGRQVTLSNSLAAHPGVVAQYDVEANGGRPTTAVLATTQVKLWWACSVAPDHRWQATGLNRVRGGTGCPACAGLQPSVTNNLARFPKVAAQLDVARNGGRTPEEIVAATDEKLWWMCPVADDHRWRTKGYDRVRKNSGCPACAGRQASITNSLAARFPELAEQFDVTANGTTSDLVVATTSELLWWACPVAPDHRWRARGAARVAGTGCPACFGRQVSITNSLANHPHLAAQFDVVANGGRTPDRIVAGTPEKLWWMCPVAPDHRWAASGDSRVRSRSGCPACAGLQASTTNSLANHPELAAQFDVVANGFTPEQVVAGTNRKLWWICRDNPDHRWAATGVNRVKGRGCPSCAVVAVSIREVRLAAELAAVFLGLDVEDRRVVLPGRRAVEADVLDRQRRLIVEYDGEYWHAGEAKEQRDREKTTVLTEAGYTVIRVREAALSALTAADIVIREDDPIHVVTAAVLDRVAELRPDLLTAAQADAYRRHGRPLASAEAEARLAELRSR